MPRAAVKRRAAMAAARAAADEPEQEDLVRYSDEDTRRIVRLQAISRGRSSRRDATDGELLATVREAVAQFFSVEEAASRQRLDDAIAVVTAEGEGPSMQPQHSTRFLGGRTAPLHLSLFVTAPRMVLPLECLRP